MAILLAQVRQPFAPLKSFTESLHKFFLCALGEVGMGLCCVARLDGIGEMDRDVAIDVAELSDHGRHVGNAGK